MHPLLYKCCHYYTFYLPHSLLRKELPTVIVVHGSYVVTQLILAVFW